jgi:ADP-ribosylglycohydrolase
MKRNKEHYRGGLFGGAVGDAFGSAVEFLWLASRNYIGRQLKNTEVGRLFNEGWLYSSCYGLLGR